MIVHLHFVFLPHDDALAILSPACSLPPPLFVSVLLVHVLVLGPFVASEHVAVEAAFDVFQTNCPRYRYRYHLYGTEMILR